MEAIAPEFRNFSIVREGPLYRLAHVAVLSRDGARLAIKGRPANEELLGTADLQSLADLGNTFEVVESMRIVPFSRDNALLLALAAVLPMLPLLLIVLPLNELIVRGVKSVFDL